jgi:hypothetical protein
MIGCDASSGLLGPLLLGAARHLMIDNDVCGYILGTKASGAADFGAFSKAPQESRPCDRVSLGTCVMREQASGAALRTSCS